MYSTPDEDNVIRAAEQLMEETMSRYDPSHDSFHVQRVRKTALSIAHAVSNTTPRKPDFLIIELAALLHDVLDKKYVSEEQASDAFSFFAPFFQKMAQNNGVDLISDGRAHEIVKIINNVSWSTEKKLKDVGGLEDWHRECIELHCVQDADRLDAIGAFGILRSAAYSAVKNQPLHVPPGHPQQGTMIQHFYDKLLNIRDRLKTEPGKQMGAKRHHLMVEFLKSIDEEYNANDRW